MNLHTIYQPIQRARLKFCSLLAFWFLITVAPVSAQSHFLLQSEKLNQVGVEFGLQPSPILRIQYGRQLPWKLASRTQAVGLSLQIGPTRALGDNIGLAANWELLLAQKGRFAVFNRLHAGYAQLDGHIYQARKIVVGDEVTAGFYWDRISVAAVLEYQHNLAVHLTHSDFYLETIYPGARDGWLSGVGGYVEAGIQGTYWIGQRYQVGLEISKAWTNRGEALSILPIHAVVRAGVLF